MHSPKFLCCACLGTKWGSVGSDCVSNLDINRQGWESTLLPCSCQFASGSLVRIPTYPVTTGAARARDRHGRENLKHFCVWDSKPLTLRGLLVSSTFSCLKLPKKSILRNWKYTITQKKKKSLFFFSSWPFIIYPKHLSLPRNLCIFGLHATAPSIQSGSPNTAHRSPLFLRATLCRALAWQESIFILCQPICEPGPSSFRLCLLIVKTNKQKTHMSISVSWSQDVSIIDNWHGIRLSVTHSSRNY